MENKESMEKRMSETREVISSLLGELDILDEEKVKTYRAYLEKIEPIIKFMRDGGYYFRHPDFEEGSGRGPILGKDTYRNILYVLDLEDNRVKEIDLYDTNNEPKVSWLDRYLIEYDFEVAMKGLSSLIDYPEELVRVFKDRIEKSNALIEKYTIKESQ